MSKFKAGDVVIVKDWGRQFTTYTDWFIGHKDEIPIEWMIKYSYDNRNFEYEPIDMRYVVLYVDDYMYLIGNCNNEFKHLRSVYLIHEDGIEFAPRRMTQAEIEKALGYKIEIVGDDEDDE